MKEKYYSKNDINRRAQKFLDNVKYLRDWHDWKLNPKSAALLVVDMQKYFLDKNSHACIPSASAIVSNIKQLQDAFLSCNLPVIQTRHINNDKNAGQLLNWWGEVITEDNPLSTLINELRDDRAEIVIKSQYDAFLNSRLEKLLKDRAVAQVIITGVMTHLCCESTARGAFMRGFEVLFTIDGTATHHEDFHRATLLNLAHGFAVPVLTEEILKNLDSKI